MEKHLLLGPRKEMAGLTISVPPQLVSEDDKGMTMDSRSLLSQSLENVIPISEAPRLDSSQL